MTDPIATEVLDRCPSCTAAGSVHWAFATDLLLATTDRTFEYRRCRSCSVLFMGIRPLESQTARLYPTTYQPYAEPDDETEVAGEGTRHGRTPRRTGLAKRIDRIVNSRIPRSYKALGEGAVFLDFGCGSGRFLDRMRARGLSTIGMDFSQQALDAAARGGHQALPVSREGWDRLPPGSVDFVRMNHVLEHLHHARRDLEELRERMKPGAMLHIAVPNPNGLSALLFRRNWHGLDCPRHLVLYPPGAVERLLVDCGFTVATIVQEGITKDFIRSLIYRIQAAGRLRRRSPDEFMDVWWLRALAAIPMGVALLAGRSDRFHAIAIRAR